MMRWPFLYRWLGEILWAPFRMIQASENALRSFRFRTAARAQRGVRFLPSARVLNIGNRREAITIGANSVIAGELLTFRHGGAIKIGDWCYVGEGSRIWSAECIVIGNRVLIAHNVNIHDSNSHPLDAPERHRHFREIAQRGHPQKIENILSSQVIIEDDVWIGFNVIILKGVTIGRGSVIGAGSIVTKDLPPFSRYVKDDLIKSQP